MSAFSSVRGRDSAPAAASDVPSSCPVCRSSSITTTAKQPNANSYWRCTSCGEIWNVSRRFGARSSALTHQGRSE